MTLADLTDWWRDLRRPDPDRLVDLARDAALVRRHHANPDVIAFTVARIRAGLDRVMWLGIVLGLLWTASSVQQWQAAGAPPWSLPWLTAWLTTAPVEIPLVAILLGEQHAARYDVRPGRWTRGARLGLLAIMLTLNVWGAAALLADGDPATGGVGLLVAHVLVPAAVVLATEAVTDLRDTLGRAIEWAATRAAEQAAAERAERTRQRRERVADTPDVPDTPPAGIPAGLTTRERGVRWALDHRHRTGEMPTPKAVRDGMHRDFGLTVSPGESSKIRAAAAERYLAGDDDGEATG